MDADNIPIVIPFVHTGMQNIMPVGAKVPRIGKEVSLILIDSLANGTSPPSALFPGMLS